MNEYEKKKKKIAIKIRIKNKFILDFIRKNRCLYLNPQIYFFSNNFDSNLNVIVYFFYP